MSKWSDEQARQIGKAIKALRGNRTGQWLADRTAELGHPISRTTISELEGEDGRRKHVTTSELAVLAAALNVPPVVLLYPGPDYSEYIEVLPGIERKEIEAAQWFSGIADHGFTDWASRPGEPAGAGGAESARIRQEYRNHTRMLRLWRELEDTYRKISSVRLPARRVDGEMVLGELSEAQLAQLDSYNDQVHSLRHQLGIEADDGG